MSETSNFIPFGQPDAPETPKPARPEFNPVAGRLSPDSFCVEDVSFNGSGAFYDGLIPAVTGLCSPETQAALEAAARPRKGWFAWATFGFANLEGGVRNTPISG